MSEDLTELFSNLSRTISSLKADSDHLHDEFITKQRSMSSWQEKATKAILDKIKNTTEAVILKSKESTYNDQELEYSKTKLSLEDRLITSEREILILEGKIRKLDNELNETKRSEMKLLASRDSLAETVKIMRGGLRHIAQIDPNCSSVEIIKYAIAVLKEVQ